MHAAGYDRDATRLALLAALTARVAAAPTPPDPQLASLAAQVPPELASEGRALSARADAIGREWGNLGGVTARTANLTLADPARAIGALGQTDTLLAEGEAFDARFLEWISGRGLAVRSLLDQISGIRSLRQRIAVIRALASRGAPPKAFAAELRTTDREFGALRPATLLAPLPRGSQADGAEGRTAPPSDGVMEGWQ